MGFIARSCICCAPSSTFCSLGDTTNLVKPALQQTRTMNPI